MKKVLLLIISLFVAQTVYAYQTVLVDFPQSQGWHADYYAQQGYEAILQYVPAGQSSANWTKTVVFHSYKSPDQSDSASSMMDKLTSQMEMQNSSQAYKYLKYTDNDSIATRCVKKNSRVPTQCEIFRIANSFEGLISMQYINKNVSEFKSTYNSWFKIMRDITIYYSYYRDDRVLDKATIFEL